MICSSFFSFSFRYSTPAAPTSLRTGTLPCDSPTFYCPRGTGIKIETPVGHYAIKDVGSNLFINAASCGSKQYYCANGIRTQVATGYYSTGGGANGLTAVASSMCEAGYYCHAGARIPCSPGKYSQNVGTDQSSTCLSCARMSYNALPAKATAPCTACASGRFSREGAELCWPAVVKAEAVDTGNQPGLGNGDSIIVTFAGPTSRPGIDASTSTSLFNKDLHGFQQLLLTRVLTQQESLALSVLGSSFTFHWHNSTVLQVTINNVQGMSDRANTRVGRLRVDVSSSADLQDDLRKSQFATPFENSPSTHALLSGTWGNFNAPTIANVTAQNAKDLTALNTDSWRDASTAGITLDDSVVVDFDIETNGNMNDELTDLQVRSLVQFNAGALDGVTLQGKWSLFATRLTITFVQGNVAGLSELVRVGALSVAVKETAFIQSRDLSSTFTSGTEIHFLNGGNYGDAISDLKAKLMSSSKVQLSFCPPSNDAADVDVRARQARAWRFVPTTPRRYQLQWRVVNATGGQTVHSKIVSSSLKVTCTVVPCTCKTRKLLSSATENYYEQFDIDGLKNDMNVYIRVRVVVDDPLSTSALTSFHLAWGPPVYPVRGMTAAIVGTCC